MNAENDILIERISEITRQSERDAMVFMSMGVALLVLIMIAIQLISR